MTNPSHDTERERRESATKKPAPSWQDASASDEPAGRVALVTGSGRRRVGHVIARSLGQAGFRIALHYHQSAQTARQNVAEFREAGIEAEAYQANVADESEVDRMFDQLIARFNRIDVLVTAASVWSPIPLEQLTADDLRRDFDINALGTFLCARRAGLIMAQQPTGGAIVTMGDWAIRRPYRDHAAYFISKGTIPTMTRTLAVELAHRNPRVRVNCILPGPVMFPDDLGPTERKRLVEATLVRQANVPESVAHTVRFLVENPFVTGVVLPVDGGRTIYAPE